MSNPKQLITVEDLFGPVEKQLGITADDRNVIKAFIELYLRTEDKTILKELCSEMLEN
jgi:hypothetical protein